MGLTTTDLMQVGGLNSDGVLGFEAQVALARTHIQAVWPEHFHGARVVNFERGSAMARDWMVMRRATGVVRRRIRLRERREVGMMSELRPTGADLREEQLECLRQVAARHARLDAERTELAAQDAVAAAEADVFTGAVAVYKSLGGVR